MKSICKVVKAQVRVNGNLRDGFECPRGLKQGDFFISILCTFY